MTEDLTGGVIEEVFLAIVLLISPIQEELKMTGRNDSLRNKWREHRGSERCHLHSLVSKKNLVLLRSNSLGSLNVETIQQGNLIDTATNLRYLIERATTDDPDRFMLKRRVGLRRASYPANRENASLIDLLEAFAADITEELSLFPRRLNQLDGAVDAAIRYQIKYLKRAYRSLFGEPDNAVISRLLSAINDISISRSRVTKVRI